MFGTCCEAHSQIPLLISPSIPLSCLRLQPQDLLYQGSCPPFVICSCQEQFTSDISLLLNLVHSKTLRVSFNPATTESHQTNIRTNQPILKDQYRKDGYEHEQLVDDDDDLDVDVDDVDDFLH